MAAGPPLSRLVLGAASVADDLGYVALADLGRALGGRRPMLCFLDATGEALAGILRPGNAAANSGADQLAVVDAAIAQLPRA